MSDLEILGYAATVVLVLGLVTWLVGLISMRQILYYIGMSVMIAAGVVLAVAITAYSQETIHEECGVVVIENEPAYVCVEVDSGGR